MHKPNFPNERGCYPQTPPPSRSADPDQPCFPDRPGDPDEGCFPQNPTRRRRRRADLFDLLDLIRPR
jgi:hypothetical protein